MADQTPPPEPEPLDKNETRPYIIYAHHELDLSAADNEALALLKEYGKLNDGKVSLMVRVGRAQASSAKDAVKALGQIRDLDGNYETLSEKSRQIFPNVKTSKRVDVEFG